MKNNVTFSNFTMKSKKIKHPLDRQFDTIEEAAKAKTESLVKAVLKGVDLSSLKK